jgi:endonuclease/exonuclease/phosphatase (EEP) superfamily protein YafD
MDFVTSGGFLGISAIILSVFVISTMRKLTVFFTLASTVGFVLLATIIAVTIMALAGVDRFEVSFAHPPV